MRLFLLVPVVAAGCAAGAKLEPAATPTPSAPADTAPATAAAADATPASSAAAARFAYPAARVSDHVDVYHGVSVADPYRWLEDADSPETRAWIEAENRLTEQFLGAIPARAAIRARLTELWDYERFDVPEHEGGRYFFSRNSGLQNQSVVYWTDRLDGEPRLLLDPNLLSADGTKALSGTQPSFDGRYFAYAVSDGGSDWMEWRVREVETGKDLEDRIEWVKFSGVAWDRAGKGFYYSRFDEPQGAALAEANFNNKLYYHRLGTPQSADELLLARADHREWQFHPEVTRDGRYLLVTVSKGTDDKYILFYRDLTKRRSQLQELVGSFDADYSFIVNDGPVLYFATTRDAARGRIIAIDVRNKAVLREIVPESADTLVETVPAGKLIVARYLRDVLASVRVFSREGKLLGEVPLPGPGSVRTMSGTPASPELFFSFESRTRPRAIFRYDVDARTLAVFKEPRVLFDHDAYETAQVFYTSKDGTRVPMLVSHKKGLEKTGALPTLMYGYGGFDISVTPTFSVGFLAWLELGGVLAVPNLRGGGEYGEAWHQAGVRGNKQNVFDDFYAAAEWLIANGYTRPDRLAIHGGSNGGLLVGAAMTQRPELFGAALPAVGVHDMLRFHEFTIGWAWIDDYGSPDIAEDFAALRAYSPLHNVRAGTRFPPTLLTTADHDDRVVPAHSFKFAAALQAAQAGDAPILIRIETRAGHGAGKPTQKRIEEVADQWAFLVSALGMHPLEPVATRGE